LVSRCDAFFVSNVLKVFKYLDFMRNTYSFSPDRNENPFFNCFGLKPKAIEKRLQWIAGIAIVENAYCFASKL
jgi:hypothetical protein